MVSLVAAMFVYKYKKVYELLPSIRNLNTIKTKNALSYDSTLGAITLTFFPINVLNLLFVAPVLFFRSKRISDFLLKIQYVFIVLIYAFVGLLLLVALSPILVLKMVLNSVNILLTNKR